MALKVVIDTNVWISALINPHGYPARLRESFEQRLFQCVISAPMLEELIDVLKRPRIREKYNITAEEIEELVILIEERSETVLLTGGIDVCRDTDDNMVIETALKGHALFIVTRDDDVKFDNNASSFLNQHNISVTTIAKFLNALEQI